MATTLDRAIKIVEVAISEDQKGNYEEAYKQYQNALDYFMLALKWEQNPEAKELIRRKVEEYMERADALKGVPSTATSTATATAAAAAAQNGSSRRSAVGDE